MVGDVYAGSESIEGIWNQTKYDELNNFTTDKLETLKSRVERLIAAKQDQTEFLQDFVRVAGLELLWFH
ncbi:putative transposase [Natrinema limicola JCM 13563]|uniref:Putative transposase n=1 Tax=Natrinema limicola JCM 13563 TaxID=1230457 RepID=M0C188_9EURY|nr:putative transposase [Natrinema limicola JCM 13563]